MIIRESLKVILELKIIALVPLPPEVIGGIEEYIYSVMKNISNMKDIRSILILTSSPIRKESSLVFHNSVPKRFLGKRLKIIRTKSLTLFRRAVPIFPIKMILTLIKEIKNSDVVHISIPFPGIELLGAIIARLMRKPVVTTYYADPVLSSEWGSLLIKILELLYIKFSLSMTLNLSKVIVISSKEYSKHSQILQKYNSKLFVIYQGIRDDFKLFLKKMHIEKQTSQKSNEIKTILSISRLVPYKGIEVLLHAFNMLIHEYNFHKIRLIICGDGYLRNKLEELTRKLGLSKQVHFTGKISEKKKWELLSTADLFVAPSISPIECVPISLLEALAVGTPSIYTKVGGVIDQLPRSELISSVDGGNERQLAQKMAEMLRCTSTRFEKKPIYIRCWSEVAKEYAELFQYVLKTQ